MYMPIEIEKTMNAFGMTIRDIPKNGYKDKEKVDECEKAFNTLAKSDDFKYFQAALIDRMVDLLRNVIKDRDEICDSLKELDKALDEIIRRKHEKGNLPVQEGH